MTKLIILIIIVVFALSAVMARFGRRSGVSTADMLRKLPGDDVIGDAGYIADRATLIPASAEVIWPWLVQLGKGRAGWYAPLWLERIIVPSQKRRGAREIITKYQKLAVGDIVPDWGPASLKVMKLKPAQTLLYVSARDPESTEYLFSWVHMLEPVDDNSCRLYTRFRLRRPKRPLTRMALMFLPIGGFFDYVTIIVMYAGLKERVKNQNK